MPVWRHWQSSGPRRQHPRAPRVMRVGRWEEADGEVPPADSEDDAGAAAAAAQRLDFVDVVDAVSALPKVAGDFVANASPVT